MTRKILRYLYRNLLPARFKSSIDLFENLRQNSHKTLHEKKLLVLSPHPDDDIIGCGGTLHRYHKEGAVITVVYMTDGRKGGISYNEEELVLVRKEEASKAAFIIGVDKLIFLENKDAELALNEHSVKELSDIIENIQPEAVFLPFFTDNHADHIATNGIFLRAALKHKNDIMCYGYEIWTPLMSPNCIVNITSQLEIKKKALEQHQSQTSQLPLVEAMIGLARYRGVLYTLKDNYAEAFLQCPLSEYKRFYEIVDYKYY